MDDLTTQKLQKAIQSIHRAIENIDKGNKRLAVGDLDFAKDRCQSAIYLLLDDIKNNKIS